jgi:hypothetical protein
MCLYEEAHGVDASHPIFQGPFPVSPTWHEMPTPEHYLNLDAALGPSLRAWRVHRDKMPKQGYVGVVADGFGFHDSPDAEWIASGRNSKNARAAALARHGNFFHWGFAASPPEMTDEAQRVFLNTLAYMQKFAGQRPLVIGESRSREWLPAMLSVDQPLADYVKQQLPPSWLEQKGDDRDGLRALATAELGFLRRDARKWLVDADCKRLGLDNRQPTSLRRCIELVAAGGDDAKAAMAVLERYTGERFTTAAAWQQWLDDAGDRLFHSDVVGQFRVAPRDLVKPHRPQQR